MFFSKPTPSNASLNRYAGNLKENGFIVILSVFSIESLEFICSFPIMLVSDSYIILKKVCKYYAA